MTGQARDLGLALGHMDRAIRSFGRFHESKQPIDPGIEQVRLSIIEAERLLISASNRLVAALELVDGVPHENPVRSETPRPPRREGPPMTPDPHAMPVAPDGFVACRTMFPGGQITHLVALDEKGSNGGRPTACGLTRFDDRNPDGTIVPNSAGLPGWGLNGGHSGPNVNQVQCEACYLVATQGNPATEGNGQ